MKEELISLDAVAKMCGCSLDQLKRQIDCNGNLILTDEQRLSAQRWLKAKEAAHG